MKMADLHFVDFALIPSPVRKEKLMIFSDLFCHGRAILHSVFPCFLEFSHRGQTAVRRSVLEMFYTTLHDEGEARNFNISALRGRNRRLLTTVM